MTRDPTSAARILLADDHENFLATATSILEPEFAVVGAVTDGQALIDAATKLQPDVLITDISMPVCNGIEAVKRLRDSGSTARVIFLTVHSDPDFVRAALAAGAFGYVIKTRVARDLVQAIHEALAGRVFLSPTVTAKN